MSKPWSHAGRQEDVCALCDRPIVEKDHSFGGLHLYVGPGWCHGGPRELIPCHVVCLTLGSSQYDYMRHGYVFEETPLYELAVNYYRQAFVR